MPDKKITPELRRRLKRPHGKVYTGRTAARRLRKTETVISVGDIATEILLKNGVTPAVAIVDFKCRRKDVAKKTKTIIQKFRAKTLKAKNPPGTVSSQLYDACRAALLGKTRPMKILVDGEEDLAVIPAVIFAPAGAAVYYGQPGKGGVVIEVGAHSKKKFSEVYKSMPHAGGRGTKNTERSKNFPKAARA